MIRVILIAILASSAATAQTTKPTTPKPAKVAPSAAKDEFNEIQKLSRVKCGTCKGTGKFRSRKANGQIQSTACGSCDKGTIQVVSDPNLYARLVAIDTSKLKTEDAAEANRMIDLGLRQMKSECREHGLQHMITENIALSKDSPVGRSLAFRGSVRWNEDGIATLMVSTPQKTLTVRVQVPAGVRWVRDADVFVIGTVIAADNSSLLVEPMQGTE